MRYEWNPEQTFSLKGSDLAIINAIMEMHLSNPTLGEEVQEATRVLNLHAALMEGKAMFNNLMEEGVKAGTVIGTDENDTSLSQNDLAAIALEKSI